MIKQFECDENGHLAALVEGSTEAFAYLYGVYKPLVFRNALKMLKNEVYAQEILQEVFLKVWKNRRNIDPDKSFQAFLFQIMRNSVFDFFRKASRDQNIHSVLATYMQSDCEHRNHVEEQIYFKETAHEIELAIETLPPKCKEVFILCKIEGKSYEEVANRLKISIATVNNHIVKGTKIIKERLKTAEISSLIIYAILMGL